jgi:hypothetical protein
MTNVLKNLPLVNSPLKLFLNKTLKMVKRLDHLFCRRMSFVDHCLTINVLFGSLSISLTTLSK